MKRLVFVTLLIASPTLSRGAMIYGTGTASCGQWVKDATGYGYQGTGDKIWLAGFLSGYSAYRPNATQDIAGPDIEGATAWVLSYCQANPTDSAAKAAQAFVTFQEGKQ